VSIQQLESAARVLEPILDDLVFVGGAVVPLLLTDTAAQSARVTRDVDAVDVKAVSIVRTYARAEQLRELGFQEAPELMGRWQHRDADVLIDIMSPRETPLAPANRWYPRAAEHATWHALPSGREIRLVDAVTFVATKLVAYESRGGRDALASHDLEDVLTVIASREEFLTELAAAESTVRIEIAASLAETRAHSGFEAAVASAAGYSAADQARVPLIHSRIEMIVASA